MPRLCCHIPQAVQKLLERRSKESGETLSHTVSKILAENLELTLHTLFQVSVTRALVQGIYARAVSSPDLLQLGNFGLGTFEGLDGEMVILDHEVYQARGDGTIHKIEGDVGTPFAFVLNFVADQADSLAHVQGFHELTSVCDRHRTTENEFYALRIDGLFSLIHCRAMQPAAEGVPLAEAAKTQPEFSFTDVNGTLVGLWVPPFASAFNVPGYHFHFLSDDRTKGGHLLDLSGADLRLRVQHLSEFHLSLPESAEFLQADLTKDTTSDLVQAEQAHPQESNQP